MAIGTLGIAALAAGASALGGGGSGAGKAAKASQAATNASIAAQKDIYNQNKATLSPYVNAGLPATQNINALLGIGGTDWAGFVNADPWRVTDWQQNYPGMSIEDYGKYNYNYDLQRGRAQDPNYKGFDLSQYDSTAAANRAFDQFRKSTGYDFRLKQGMNALNAGYAGSGTLKSGAAIKGAIDYGQGMASQEFGNYLNALGSQQGVGLGAASAQAGVGTDYANSLGKLYMQNGENQADLALVKAQNKSNNLNGLLNTVGMFAARGF